MQTDLLKKQLERARFERAFQVAESLALHRALLTTTELARLNEIVTVNKEKRSSVFTDPWRHEAVTITLPTGQEKTLTLMIDPILMAREKLHHSTEMAEQGLKIESGIKIYVELILAHVFKDANRRTASLASHYFFKRYGVPVSGMDLYQLGLGDLRQENQIQSLTEKVCQMAKFGEKRNLSTLSS